MGGLRHPPRRNAPKQERFLGREKDSLDVS